MGWDVPVLNFPGHEPGVSLTGASQDCTCRWLGAKEFSPGFSCVGTGQCHTEGQPEVDWCSVQVSQVGTSGGPTNGAAGDGGNMGNINQRGSHVSTTLVGLLDLRQVYGCRLDPRDHLG